MRIFNRRHRLIEPITPAHRGVVHGHVIDVRDNGWGTETVLVNGAQISQKSSLLSTPSHLFTLTDEHGRTRNVEIRAIVRLAGLLGVRGYLVMVDGVERGILDRTALGESIDRCLHCGYSIGNLPVVNGEVQCPECGRHRDATLLMLTSKARLASAPPNNPPE